VRVTGRTGFGWPIVPDTEIEYPLEPLSLNSALRLGPFSNSPMKRSFAPAAVGKAAAAIAKPIAMTMPFVLKQQG